MQEVKIKSNDRTMKTRTLNCVPVPEIHPHNDERLKAQNRKNIIKPMPLAYQIKLAVHQQSTQQAKTLYRRIQGFLPRYHQIRRLAAFGRNPTRTEHTLRLLIAFLESLTTCRSIKIQTSKFIFLNSFIRYKTHS